MQQETGATGTYLYMNDYLGQNCMMYHHSAHILSGFLWNHIYTDAE